MLTIDDIDRWNVVELELFAKVCGDVLQHCEDLEATLDGRVLVPSWEGDASDASHRRLESMSRAIAETGGAVHDIREAVATAVSGVRPRSAQNAGLDAGGEGPALSTGS